MSETYVVESNEYRFILDKDSLIVTQGTYYQNEFRRKDISQIGCTMTEENYRKYGMITITLSIIIFIAYYEIPRLPEETIMIGGIVGILGLFLYLYTRKESQLVIDLVGGQQYSYMIKTDISKITELSREIFRTKKEEKNTLNHI